MSERKSLTKKECHRQLDSIRAERSDVTHEALNSARSFVEVVGTLGQAPDHIRVDEDAWITIVMRPLGSRSKTWRAVVESDGSLNIMTARHGLFPCLPTVESIRSAFDAVLHHFKSNTYKERCEIQVDVIVSRGNGYSRAIQHDTTTFRSSGGRVPT